MCAGHCGGDGLSFFSESVERAHAQGSLPEAGEAAELDLEKANAWSARLAQVVDLPTPAERAKGARKLAATKDVSLEEWLEICRTFLPLPKSAMARPLASQHDNIFQVQVDLQVMGKVESTEIAFAVPVGYLPRVPCGLLLLLHGAGGDGPSVLKRHGDWAQKFGLLVFAPSEAGDNLGHSGKPRERASVLAAMRWMRLNYNVDENRIFVAGFSRGGHLTWDLILRNPDLFAGAIPMAGAPRYTVRGAQTTFDLCRILPTCRSAK